MMIEPNRLDVARFNPLVGQDTSDTMENLRLCLCQMGRLYAEKYQDETMGFFCSVLAAALDFEREQLKVQRPIREVDPACLASSSG